MAHFAGTHTASGGRDYSTTGEIAKASIPSTKLAFEQLIQLQKEGKVKHIGVSNFGVTQLKEAMATGAKISVNQLCYNLIFRAVEFDIIPFCKDQGIGVIAYSPLMQGILTGRYKTADEVPTFRARSRQFSGKRDKSRHGEDGHEEELFKAIAAVQAISKREGISMVDIALSWPLHNDAVGCVIAGATKDSQVHGNAKSISTKLSPAVYAELCAVTDVLKNNMGSNADLWQGGDDGRIK
jgi:aryl-alcohol dehydrogenase-like predicted oxidoreductase